MGFSQSGKSSPHIFLERQGMTTKKSFRSRFTTIRSVRQIDYNGCGVSCVAMLSGHSYKKARETIFGKGAKRIPGTTYDDLRHAFKVLGIRVKGKSRPFWNWESIPRTAIVAINYNRKSETWHWVLLIVDRKRRFVKDPQSTRRGLRRVDFSRMRGMSYMLI